MPPLFILLPLGLILFSLIFFSRGILIFLTTFCLMLAQSRIIRIRTVATNLRWVFFILFALHVFGDIFLVRTVRRIKFFDILAIVFITYALLSTSYSPYPILTLERTATLLLLYISVFWIIWKYAFHQGPEKVVLLILQAALPIFIASYLIIFVGHFQPFLFNRFQGLFENPNSLGIICAILLPLAFWQFFETKKKTGLVLIFLMFLGLFLSASRSSINAIVIAMAYFIYARSKRQRPLVFFFSTSFVLIIVWVIQTIAKQFFMGYIRAESIPLGGGRFQIWTIALNLISDKPIFGYGFGIEDRLFQLKRIALYLRPGTSFPLSGVVFNSYLGMMLQLGILGFIIFFVPLFILLFTELFSKQDNETPLLRYALRASLIAGLFSSFFEGWIYSVGSSQSFPYWNIVMLLLFYRHKDKEKISLEST